MSAEQEPAAAKAVAGVLSEQTVVQSAVEAAGKMHQFTEVLLGEASETSELPEGFRFHWMSEIPVWKATLAGLSETEQAEVMRRACSEDQPVTEGYTPYGTIQDAAGREWRRLGCAQSRASHDLAG